MVRRGWRTMEEDGFESRVFRAEQEAKLAEAGLIGTPDPHQIQILDRVALKDIAEGLPPAEFT